jgi:hypothetical protein
MTTGFQIVNSSLEITKDPEAVLTYNFDWSEWLLSGDTIDTATYTLQVRANDPQPLINEASGKLNATTTYITLSSGQVDKLYTVTCKVVTTNNLTDRRSFRVKVLNRSA